MVCDTDQRRLHTTRIVACTGEWRIPVQVQDQRVGRVLTTAGRVTGHIESRIPGVLHVEDAGAGTKRPVIARRPRPSDPGREVQFVVVDEAPAQLAASRGLDVGRKADRRVLVEIALANSNQHRMTGQIGYRQTGVAIRQIRIDQRAASIQPWRNVFVAEAEIEGHVLT